MTNKDNASKAREIANEFANENVRPAIIAAEEMMSAVSKSVETECREFYVSLRDDLTDKEVAEKEQKSVEDFRKAMEKLYEM